MQQRQNPHYAGFWIRTAAHIIDSILFMMIALPMILFFYGQDSFNIQSFLFSPGDILINYIFPTIAVITFWTYKSATPGKMALGLTIVDASSFNKPSVKQFLIRYAGYIVSTLPLFLGLLWVAIDHRKQAWHDKLANTVVLIKN